MEFETYVSGIPCIVRVLSYEPYVPAYTSGPPESCYPEEGSESEWEVLDMSGRRAPWLEKKLTDADIDRIEQEVIDHMEQEDEII